MGDSQLDTMEVVGKSWSIFINLLFRWAMVSRAMLHIQRVHLTGPYRNRNIRILVASFPTLNMFLLQEPKVFHV